jgi:hypothetical protein
MTKSSQGIGEKHRNEENEQQFITLTQEEPPTGDERASVKLAQPE